MLSGTSHTWIWRNGKWIRVAGGASGPLALGGRSSCDAVRASFTLITYNPSLPNAAHRLPDSKRWIIRNRQRHCPAPILLQAGLRWKLIAGRANEFTIGRKGASGYHVVTLQKPHRMRVSVEEYRSGAVAQLGERLVCNQKVGGSSPLGSILVLG